MKLSNKTLIVFFGIILAYTLMAFTEIRLRGDTREFHEDNSIAESAPLSNVKYIVLSENLEKKVTIQSSETPRIEIRSKSGQVLSKFVYELANDTLLLDRFEVGENEEHFHLTLFVPSTGFTGLTTTSSSVTLTDIQQDSLTINQTGGRVTMQKDIEIDHITITQRASANCYLYNARVGTITMDLDDSDLNVQAKVQGLQGVLANKARLYSYGLNSIQLSKDNSSSIKILD